MLFHPPDFHFHSLDRVGLALLGFIVFLRVCTKRLNIPFWGPITLPLTALTLLSLAGAVTNSDAETWSLFAAKWFVPLMLFHLSAIVFDDARSLRHFETFSLIVLGYLSFIAVCFLIGQKSLIFPRYILDEGLGYHPDRARGPFLQAVANGVALNLLGLVAIDSFRRKSRRMLGVLLIILPLAILATKTRAVWLTFCGSLLVLALSSSSRRVRRLCWGLMFGGLLALATVVMCSDDGLSGLCDRLGERSPVDFRIAVYEAGGEMFLQKPLLGWDAAGMQAELSRRVSDFHQQEFYFHNTYLEILIRHGLLGFVLYLWLIFGLFRVGGKPSGSGSQTQGFLDEGFRSLWPLLLIVYWVNGFLVVMNYQFVNGFLFTIAGMLAGQNLRGTEHACIGEGT